MKNKTLRKDWNTKNKIIKECCEDCGKPMKYGKEHIHTEEEVNKYLLKNTK